MEPTTTEGEGRIDKRAVGKAIEDAAYLYRSRRQCGPAGLAAVCAGVSAVRGRRRRVPAMRPAAAPEQWSSGGRRRPGGGGVSVPERKEAAPPEQAEKGRRRRLGKRRDKRKEAAASLRSRSGTEGWGTGATPKTSM